MLKLRTVRILDQVKDSMESSINENTILEDYNYWRGYADALLKAEIVTKIGHAALLNHLDFIAGLETSDEVEIQPTYEPPKMKVKPAPAPAPTAKTSTKKSSPSAWLKSKGKETKDA